MPKIPSPFVALIAGIAIAAGSVFAFNIPVLDAFTIATDRTKARAACERLLADPEVVPAPAPISE